MGSLSHKRQELAGRLVEREVLCCVSGMVSTLLRVSQECHVEDLDYEDLMQVCVQDDWETPGIWFVNEEADLDQLEEIANHFGDWTDMEDRVGYGIYRDTCEENDTDPDDFIDWLKGQDECHEAKDSFTKALRREVESLVDDWEWVGHEFDLDADTREAYEHWVVTNWLARKLADKGEMTGEVLGLTIWGRCTSGQAISIDWVIEQIAAELWPEEWAGKEME